MTGCGAGRNGPARRSAAWLLGALLIALPEMYGVGYPVLENAVEGKYLIGMLLLLMVGKMVATSLTIGIGGSGGVFAPTLFVGAMAGTAFGDRRARTSGRGQPNPPGAYGLVGMGAALGGATRASITAVVILFELTGEYSIILPLMSAVVVAAGVSHVLSKQTIYTAKLWRRGIDLERPVRALATFTAADVAGSVPEPLADRTLLGTAVAALTKTPTGMLPVIGADGTYHGCVSAEDAIEALDDPRPPETVAGLVRQTPTVRADAEAESVVGALAGHGGTGLPVLSDDGTELIGWVTYEDVLRRMEFGSTGTSPAPG